MKVLFVSSGNKKTKISTIVKKQGDSLVKIGIDVIYFTVKGKGFLGYLKNIPEIRKVIKENSIDLIHAHYSLCGFVSSLTLRKTKIIVSLMGSDVLAKGFWRILIKLFYYASWSAVIVKSNEMKEHVGLKNTLVIPNGVDTNMFFPLPQDDARKKLGWDLGKKHILFAGDPDRKEKNFQLANNAFYILKEEHMYVELHVLKDVEHDKIPYMMNAADVVLLTSSREGSPNVIKEAMACSRPIVSTNVGDVKEVINSTDNCFVVNPDVKEIVVALKELISKSIIKTNGRENIANLAEEKVSKKLMECYQSIINAKR